MFASFFDSSIFLNCPLSPFCLFHISVSLSVACSLRFFALTSASFRISFFSLLFHFFFFFVFSFSSFVSYTSSVYEVFDKKFLDLVLVGEYLILVAVYLILCLLTILSFSDKFCFFSGTC